MRVGRCSRRSSQEVEELGDGSKKIREGLRPCGAAAKGLAAGGMMAIVSAAGEALGSLMALSDETRIQRGHGKLKTAFTNGEKRGRCSKR